MEVDVPNGEAVSNIAHGSMNQPEQQLIEAEEPPSCEVSSSRDILSGKELFFRRGQAVVAAIAVLLVGVLVRLLLKNG